MPDLPRDSTNGNDLPQELLDKARSDDKKDRLEAVNLLSDNHRKEDQSLKDEAKKELERLWEHDKSFDVRRAAKKALDRKPNNNEIPLWKKLLISTAVLVVLFGILEFTRVVDIIPGFPGDGGRTRTPEDAISGIFDAMKSGDIDAMAQYMAEDERSRITDMTDEEKEMAEGMLTMMSEIEYNIKGTEIDGETADVTIDFTFMGETTEQKVELILENGSWVVVNGPI